MATTRLSDVLYSPLFLPAVINKTTSDSIIRTAGLASPDPRIQAFANGPGDLLQLPFWNDLSGDSNVSTDDPAQNATPNKIAQGQDYARKIRRNNGWQTANLVSSLLAEDPLDIIAQLVADYWVREEQKILIQILNGVFAAASMSGNLLPLASEAGVASPVNMDAEVSADAHALLGDQGLSLVAVAMHSRIFWNLVAANAIVFKDNPAGVTPGDLANMIAFYQGKRVIVSDSCPRVAGTTSGFKYTSYLFAAGAIGYAEATGAGGPEIPVEMDSKPEAGNGEGVRTVWHRRHWVMHLRGVAFTGTPASASGVTNAELATGTNWTRVWDPKNVRVVAVTTNG